MSQATGQVVVIGAGISGLSAAYDLARAGLPCTVFEKRPRPGGVIETRVTSGCVLECGPDSFITQKPEALALIKELGLSGDVIGSNDRDRHTYIWKQGRLVRLPEGVMMMVPSRAMPILKSPLLGWGTKLRMGLEWFRGPGSRGDRSVAEFVTDHFGQETLDYLAEPLLSGVYGGDPARLGTESVLPRFLKMEEQYGSLVRGVLHGRGKAGPSGPLFQTLRGGLGQLVGALASKASIAHAEVDAVERLGEGFRVRVSGEWVIADRLVLACPAHAAAHLLSAVDPALAGLLGAIEYSSSLTLSLIYPRAGFDGFHAGHGFLVPRKERGRLAACTYVGSKFLGRIPEDRIVLRCFFGGAGDGGVLNESDDALVTIARDELRRMTGLTAAPESYEIARWPGAMAQYTVGHGKRVEEIRARAGAINGLYLAGNAYEGIGIPDCIRTGRGAAQRIIGAAC